MDKKGKFFVRWMGAFGYASDFQEALVFENSRSKKDEVPGEFFKMGNPSHIKHTRVGLMVDPKEVIAMFGGDVASKKVSKVTGETCWNYHYGCNAIDGEQVLAKTRNPKKMGLHQGWGHTEFWGHPVYTGVFVDGLFNRLSSRTQSTLIEFSKHTGLPVYEYTQKGRHWKLSRVAI